MSSIRRGYLALSIMVPIVLASLSGCTPAPESGHGFTLPAGDAAVGQEVFAKMHCHSCHTVRGVDLPEVPSVLDPAVALGGEVTRISTYGELVTSIINPSHQLAPGYKEELIATDGESKMANYNDVLTVHQLIDLVAFLQSRYTLRPHPVTEYPILY